MDKCLSGTQIHNVRSITITTVWNTSDCGPQWLTADRSGYWMQLDLLQLETYQHGWLRTALGQCGSQWENVLGAVFWQQLLTAARSGWLRTAVSSDRLWESTNSRVVIVAVSVTGLRTALVECDPQSWPTYCWEQSEPYINWLRPAVDDCDPQSKAAENSF